MSRHRRNALLTLAVAASLAVTAWGVVRSGADAARASAVTTEAPTLTPTVAAKAPRARRSPGHRIVEAAPVRFSRPAGAPADEPLTPRRTLRGIPARGGAVPRSVQVLRVPVPAALPQRRSVRWEMHSGPRAEVLSAPSGRIASDAPPADRAITVVTRVPAQAAAGVLAVGEAEFTAESTSVIVPIELVVARVRRAAVAPARSGFGAIAGRTLQLGVEVRNLGNSTDTLLVEGEMPAGWTHAAPRQVVLIPGERRVVHLETKIPRASGTTAAYPSVRVRLGDSVMAQTTVPVQVDDPTEPDQPTGPLLTVGTSTAFGDSVASAAAVDFALSGAVANGVMIVGRASVTGDGARLDRRALNRAGAYLGGAFVSLRGPGWYATAGNTGATLSPLTGIGAYGRGVMAGANRGPWTMSALVTDVPGGSGMQGGGRADYQTGPRTTVGIATSHFRSAGPAMRALDAAGLIASTTPGAGFRITTEAAWRQYTGGSGTGAGITVERNTSRDMLALSAEHSPGGSEAFGRALRSGSAVYGRRFGKRIAIETNAFRSVDRPPRAGGEFTANGWTISPRYLLRPDVTAELEVRRNAFESQNPGGAGFASTDITTSATLRKVGGQVQWTAGTSVGGTERTTTLSNGTQVDLSASRLGVNAGGSMILPRVILGGGIDYSQTGAGSGLAPRQGRLTLGASRFAPFDSPRAPVFRAEAELTTWFGDRPSATIARIGSSLQLPGDMTFTIDAERNPMLRVDGARTPWIVAVRLERGFTLGWAMRAPTTSGAVFQDRNGNGVRDEDEDGLAGVMVRRGGQSTVTDATGRFRLLGQNEQPIEIDPVSLPAGVVAPTLRGGHGHAVTLGVVPTGAVAVRIAPEIDDLGRRPESRLDLLAVVARDERGAEWYLRADSTGMVRFDALPPARYTFVADFAGTTERLRQVGDPVILEVKPGENLPPLVIRITVRSARLFNGGQGQTDQGRRRR